MSAPFKFHSANTGHNRVNFTAINPQGQRVYYCIMDNEFGVFELYRSCKEWEPSWRAIPKIPLKHLIDIHSIPPNTKLTCSVRRYILNHELRVR